MPEEELETGDEEVVGDDIIDIPAVGDDDDGDVGVVPDPDDEEKLLKTDFQVEGADEDEI